MIINIQRAKTKLFADTSRAIPEG